MYMDSQVFLGMDVHVQTVDTRLLSLLPCGLGMRLDIDILPPSLYLCESSIASYSDVYAEQPCVIVSLASTASCQYINMYCVTSLVPPHKMKYY